MRRVVGGDGARSPHLLQNSAPGRFICPQGHKRSVPEMVVGGANGPGVGGIGCPEGGGAPNAVRSSSGTDLCPWAETGIAGALLLAWAAWMPATVLTVDTFFLP